MPEPYITYYASPIGNIRVGCNETCITEVHFMDEAEELPPAPGETPPVLQSCVDELNEYFQGTRIQFNVPFYQEGTVFQERVWNQLISIPFGKTISYLTLAKQLGDPKCIRAAAATNGKNKIAVIVPCHRVIGTNKDLVGYAGGVWRKRWLLEMEAKITYGVQTLF
ncbi:MAG: methylated-DNA--[protein]-cysteine S-methyltransferase [Chitinophagaceae bacterium]